MPKLNYTKRKSEGPKLGAIVRKDLGKRIRATSAHRDNSAIELNLEGKNLTDDGLHEVAAGLVEILNAPAFDEKLHLLNLANNNLTIKSLLHLAPAVEAAASELLNLDLSGNNISPSTIDELKTWEKFLESFKNCRSLRYVSFARNDLGSAPSWDVFLRAYLRQFRQAEQTLQDVDMLDLPFQEDEDSESTLKNDLAALKIGADSAAEIAADFSGLPSIQTLNLSTTGLTDAGSLFLSYVLERNPFNKVIRQHNDDQSGATTSGPGSGILWQPNGKLSSLGIKVLKDAETVPWQPSCLDGQKISGKSSFHGNSELSHGNRISLLPATSSHKRRTSQVSSELQPPFRSPSHLKDGAAEELDSLRKKLQRSIIEDGRLNTIELWISALKLLALVRQYLIPKRPINIEPRPEDWVRRPANVPKPLHTSLKSWTRLPNAPSGKPAPLSYFSQPSMGESNRSNLMPMLPAPPDLPGTPLILHKPWQRCASNDWEVPAAPQRTRTSASASEPTPHLTEIAESPNKKTDMVGKLPRKALERVLYLLADPTSILSSAQQRKIFLWGSDRATLATEQEALGKPRSVQIWRVLEALDCLTYDDHSH